MMSRISTGPALVPTLAIVLAAAWLLLGAPFAAGQEIAPPPRVGRIAWTRGQAALRPAGGTRWDAAERNYPLTVGDALWTPRGAEAGVQVSDTSLDLAGGTALTLDRLGARRLAATLPEGEVVLHVRALAPGEAYRLLTPRGTVTIATPGRYEIAAGSTTAPSLVNVYRGAAAISGPVALTLRAGQSAEISGTRHFAVRVIPALHDRFAERMLSAARGGTPPPALVAAMPGGNDLGAYGQWSATPAYGPVWYPRVGPGWVPYREGHWAYVAPWGWTWIDSDPWGFAPFHYGRWARIGPRWAWVPGPVVVVGPPEPVYAPALVTFFTLGGDGFAGGFTAGGLLAGQVGWVPLAPFEPYRPGFRARAGWVRAVNRRDVRHDAAIGDAPRNAPRDAPGDYPRQGNRMGFDRFANRGAASLVPAAALVASRPVGALARPVPARLLATARPVLGRPPVPPARGTQGMTRTLARQQGVRPLPAAVARQLPPALRPMPRRVGPVPLPGTLARPAPGMPARPAPGMPARPAPGMPARPAPGKPARPAPGMLARPGVGPGAAARGPVPRHPVPPASAPLRVAPPGRLPQVIAPAPVVRASPPALYAPALHAPALHAPALHAPALQVPGGAPRGMVPGVLPAPPVRVIAPRVVGPAGRGPTNVRVPLPVTGSHPLVPTPRPPTPSFRAPAPAYRPPAPAYRPPVVQTFHPPAPAYRAPSPAFRAPAPAYRPPAPAYRPPVVQTFHPPAPAYRPPAPAYRPPPPAYHAPAPAYRPPPPAPHPAPPPAPKRKPQ